MGVLITQHTALGLQEKKGTGWGSEEWGHMWD